jgi:hypothetical protein
MDLKNETAIITGGGPQGLPDARERPAVNAAAPLLSLPLNSIIQGHVLDVLKTFPAESVHCIITSPPYWALRNYGLEPQVWGIRGRS